MTVKRQKVVRFHIKTKAEDLPLPRLDSLSAVISKAQSLVERGELVGPASVLEYEDVLYVVHKDSQGVTHTDRAGGL
jgi:hypothetical protein